MGAVSYERGTPVPLSSPDGASMGVRSDIASVVGVHTQRCLVCTGEADVIRKETWFFYRTSSGVRLCCELEGPKGPKGEGAHMACMHGIPVQGGRVGSNAGIARWSCRGTSLIRTPPPMTLQGYLAHKKHPPPRALQ